MRNLLRTSSVFLGICLLLFVSCGREPVSEIDGGAAETKNPEAVSLLGKSLFPAAPTERVLAEYRKYESAYEADPQDVENIIWFGRFTAYKGEHNDAIRIYTQAIDKFPEDPRLYRHRGHRYITIRKFALAIEDFERAASLIRGVPNEIEPDGMPNARNIPVSTLHGNIWYHLGLAYYLTHDMDNALRAYRNCLASSTNSDNLVSSTHWLYMILRRMGQKDEAEKYLEPITADLDVIENHDYHRICLFYKGELILEDLTGNKEEGPGSDAVNYAVGNWYFYNGDKEKARAVFEQILSKDSWGSFGFIAAESQFVREFAR